MKNFIVIFAILSVIAGCFARPATQQENNTNIQQTPGVPVNEEIVVESSLHIRKKPIRQKRQFGPYGQSSALANANSFGHYQNPQGFGSSQGIAGAQAFQSQGPLGGFGASATNAGTQSLGCNYQGGCSGSAGMSGTQTYNLPGGRNVNVGYGGTYSNANGVPSIANSNTLTYTK